MLRSKRAAVALLMAVPSAHTFSSQGGPVPIDGLCTALVSFASEGCTKATPTPNKDACVAEFEEYDTTGDGNFGEKEAQAAIDAVPAQLVKALEKVDVEKGCVGEQVSRIVQDEHLSGPSRGLSVPGLSVLLQVVAALLEIWGCNPNATSEC